MKNIIKRFAIMSAALMMFCVTTVAQSEKSRKNTRSSSYGVVVPSAVTMTPNETRYLTITLLLGYDNPFLIYRNGSTETDSVIEAEIFTARILKSQTGGYFLEITAHDVNKKKSDEFFVKAMQKYVEFGLNSRVTEEAPGVCVMITVDPDNK